MKPGKNTFLLLDRVRLFNKFLTNKVFKQL